MAEPTDMNQLIVDLCSGGAQVSFSVNSGGPSRSAGKYRCEYFRISHRDALWGYGETPEAALTSAVAVMVARRLGEPDLLREPWVSIGKENCP